MAASEPLGLLLASAQGALRDARDLHDFRAKRALIASADVQAMCAVAVAIDHLAETLDRLIQAPSPEEKP